ncbi:hypothetical protein PFISCL1PPCAC_23615 [Pristionchus fissidentatus]|uniref:Uncharacterized protein n=1 Tax=Pristionchus fissidentatus TaxID=1538716 RepID=A0AAV5WNW4_9BILA|nr:hypothetical protein PFISCL1PPCAC_23615 [Pristionchus fissidentatus]
MSDSDDDEFVSASEGEEEEITKPIPTQKKVIEESVVKEESDVEESKEEKKEESVDKSHHSDGDQKEETEEEKSITQDLSHEDFKTTRDESEEEEVVEESKKEEEEAMKDEESIVPDISGLTMDDEPVTRKESTSTSSGSQKKEWENVEEIEEQSSVDEGKSGWDDWGEESVEIAEKEEEVYGIKPKIETKKVEAEEEEEEDGGEGWDDWGSEPVEAPPKAVETKKVVIKGATPSDDSDARREEMLNRLGGSSNKTTTSGGGGGGWGWGGMLSGIGESFSSAVESSLGLPSAHELAKRHADVEKEQKDTPAPPPQSGASSQPPSTSSSSFGGFGVFSGLVNGGIDVLESIGKKTFETITVREDERGRRRFIFEAERGENLSSVLRELREKNEAEAAVSALAGHSPSVPRLPDVASSFERSDGMVHLEALELVAGSRPKQRQSVQRQLMSLLENERVDAIDNDDEFVAELLYAIKQTGLPYSPDALIRVDKELDGRLRSGDGHSSEELFKEGVDSLVQFTAASVHLVSKLASLLAVMGGSDFRPFVVIFRLLSTRCTHIANLYMLAISASDSGSTADELGTQVLVESSTAIDFIRQAHALLIPIVEVK